MIQWSLSNYKSAWNLYTHVFKRYDINISLYNQTRLFQHTHTHARLQFIYNKKPWTLISKNIVPILWYSDTLQTCHLILHDWASWSLCHRVVCTASPSQVPRSFGVRPRVAVPSLSGSPGDTWNVLIQISVHIYRWWFRNPAWRSPVEVGRKIAVHSMVVQHFWKQWGEFPIQTHIRHILDRSCHVCYNSASSSSSDQLKINQT